MIDLDVVLFHLIFLLCGQTERRKIRLDDTAIRLTDIATFSVRGVCSGAFHPAVAYSVAPASADEKHAVISGCGKQDLSIRVSQLEQQLYCPRPMLAFLNEIHQIIK